MVDEPTEVQIRPATLADAPEIAQVHLASVRHAYAGVVDEAYLSSLDEAARVERWQRELGEKAPGTSVWVAVDEGHVVGFASLGPSADEDADRTTLQVHTLYLEPRAWGRGVARELMRTVLAAAGSAPVTLWVLQANERARHFYRRSGFQPDGVERLEEIGDQRLTELRYRRG